MYGGGVPWLTAVIVAIQATVIVGVWISRNPEMRATLAKKTGVRRAEDRSLLLERLRTPATGSRCRCG